MELAVICCHLLIRRMGKSENALKLLTKYLHGSLRDMMLLRYDLSPSHSDINLKT